MTWLPALITGGLALSGGLISSSLAHRSVRSLAEAKKTADRELADRQSDQRRRLAHLEHLLSDESATAMARRSYEYDALKRLYASARPLLFQLGELCEVGNRRIDKLVSGVIKLSPKSASVYTTAYRIGAPLVVVQALRRQLTTVDLRLDPVLRDQYLVARELLSVLRNGDELSLYPPTLLRQQTSEAPQQHITVRQLDGLVESLVPDDTAVPGNLKPFFQFEQECRDDSSATSERVAAAVLLLQRAHPHETPVFWRTLVAQRLLHAALLRLLKADGFPTNADTLPRPVEEPYASAFDEAHEVARAYLRARDIPSVV